MNDILYEYRKVISAYHNFDQIIVSKKILNDPKLFNNSVWILAKQNVISSLYVLKHTVQ